MSCKNDTDINTDNCSTSTIVISSIGGVGWFCLIATNVVWCLFVRRQKCQCTQKRFGLSQQRALDKEPRESTLYETKKRYVKDPTVEVTEISEENITEQDPETRSDTYENTEAADNRVTESPDTGTDTNYDYAYEDFQPSTSRTNNYENNKKMAPAQQVSTRDSTYDYPEVETIPDQHRHQTKIKTEGNCQNQKEGVNISPTKKTNRRKKKKPETSPIIEKGIKKIPVTFQVEQFQGESGTRESCAYANVNSQQDERTSDSSTTSMEFKGESGIPESHAYANVNHQQAERTSDSSTDASTSMESQDSEHTGAIILTGGINVYKYKHVDTRIYYPNPS